MTSIRRCPGSGLRRFLALPAAVAALAMAARVSSADAQVPVGVPIGGIGQGGMATGPALCVGANAPSGIGDAGAAGNQICGAALVFVGPNIGQVGAAIGPTIIGSTVIAPISVALGPIAVGGLP
jgi:hypothetical protein